MVYAAGDVGHIAVHNSLATVVAAWTSFTPSITGLTLGSPSARYTQIGKTVHVQVVGATSAHSGSFTFTLPVAAVVAGSARVIGSSYAEDVSSGLLFVGIARLTASSGTACQFIAASVTGTNTSFSATAPFTWAVGDVLSFSLTYEAA